MKPTRLFIPVFLLFVLAGCQPEEIASNEKTLSQSEALTHRAAPDKVLVCHLNEDGEYVIKEVPAPSLNGHLSHGDYLPDADNDGYSAVGACAGTMDDCNDDDPAINPGATDIPDDGIDQDCSGGDSTVWVCDCFSMQDLQNLYNYTPWPFGWWSDVPGCKNAPYDQLLELWLTNIGQPSQNFNYSAQAGTINGLPFRSHAKFNHLTGQFDVLCGGYTTAEIAEPCRQILSNFIQQLRNTHPQLDYCNL